MAQQDPGQSWVPVRPVLEGARSPEYEAEVRRRVREAWAAWDTACRQVPRAREILRQVDEQLPQVEANLTAADRQLEAARAAYVLRTVIGPGGAMLTDPEGRPMYLTHQDEEDRDPGVTGAKAERLRWIQARGRLWRHADDARAVLAHATGQRPPGERPAD